MKKLMTGISAGALGAMMAVTSLAPVHAMPLPTGSVPQYSQTEQVQYRPNRNIRQDNRNVRRSDRREWRGHRGYRSQRPGYRRHNDGWWYPLAAFGAGAVIGGALSNQPARASGNSHVQWCYDRWRSYRASDNTYQPFNGPRQQCMSPYR